jgi:hypothetical protein
MFGEEALTVLPISARGAAQMLFLLNLLHCALLQFLGPPRQLVARVRCASRHLRVDALGAGKALEEIVVVGGGSGLRTVRCSRVISLLLLKRRSRAAKAHWA